ncbi:MAG: hypothetical protein SNG02_04580 [Rikenellaceae bacterium]
MKKLQQYISMVVLLLFFFSIGGRAVVALGGCHCVRDIVEHRHHNCCGCEAHIDDCRFHTQSVDSNCASHRGGVSLVEGTLTTSKLSIDKRVVACVVAFFGTLPLDRDSVESECEEFREHEISSRHLDWICDVGLLRAPPVC